MAPIKNTSDLSVWMQTERGVWFAVSMRVSGQWLVQTFKEFQLPDDQTSLFFFSDPISCYCCHNIKTVFSVQTKNELQPTLPLTHKCLRKTMDWEDSSQSVFPDYTNTSYSTNNSALWSKTCTFIFSTHLYKAFCQLHGCRSALVAWLTYRRSLFCFKEDESTALMMKCSSAWIGVNDPAFRVEATHHKGHNVTPSNCSRDGAKVNIRSLIQAIFKK